MRNFYLIVNREKPRVEEAAGLICSFFAEQGCRCIRLDRHDGLRRDAEVLRHTAIPIAGRCRRIQIV